MIPRNDNGASAASASPVPNSPHPTKKQVCPKDTASSLIPVAVGEYFGPAGRRRLGAILVRRCPGCGHAHFHRGMRVASVDGETRTGSCGTEYKVRVLPAQRIGGAA
ncbi:hypothetical protein GCM10009836_69090 [Pseudonocardia ailaonensis]|uniref:Uncharacterized protein n=1 Tax=Pseudonocardia ailaonensis TaxID=367279 RepID=A0ABN2NNJ8_9PSEU